MYDDNNVFARILRGELPCNLIHEDDHTIAFHDLRPQAPVHALLLPKGAYVSYSDFAAKARAEEVMALTKAIRTVAEQLGVLESGYRLITNDGPDSLQEVPHLHFHILGGAPVGPLVVQDFGDDD